MSTHETGSLCILKGLRSHPAYNGHTVEVIEFDPIHDRYMVQPISSHSSLTQMLAVKSQNLILASPCGTPTNASIQSSAQFVLHGLQNTSLNGQRVSIVQYARHEQRYQVALLDPTSMFPQLMLVRPENIRPEDITPSLTESDVESTTSFSTASRRSMFQNQNKAASESSIETRGLRSCMERSGSLSNVEAVPSSGSVSSRSTLSCLIPKGSRARLQGLTVQPSLNGCLVEVHDYISAIRRYRVRLDANDDDESQNQRFMVVQSLNLKVLADLDSDSLPSRASECEVFPPGAKVKLVGLMALPHLNGTVATVDSFVREKGRYRVVTVDDVPQVLILHPRSLEWHESPVTHSATTVTAFPSPRKSPGRRSTMPSLSSPRKPPLDLEQRRHSIANGPWITKSTTPKEPLKAGTRVVLDGLADRPNLSGELAVVLHYVSAQRMHRVRVLGVKAPEAMAFEKELLVSHRNIKPAPPTAFWADMTLGGQSIRVPASFEVLADSQQIRVRLDAFAGVDRAAAAGKLLLGGDKCDWTIESEVLSTLAQNPTPPLKCVVQPPRPDCDATLPLPLRNDEVLVDVPASAKNSMFRGMVDYELLRPTGSRSGHNEIYKTCFPASSGGGGKDDENPFAAQYIPVASLVEAKGTAGPWTGERRSPTKAAKPSVTREPSRGAPVDPPADVDPISAKAVAVVGKRALVETGMTLGQVAALAAREQAKEPHRANNKDVTPAFKPHRVRWSDTVEELTFLVSS